MKLFGTVSTMALLGLAAPALALDLGGGFSLTGNLEYERINTSYSDQSVGILDADISYEHASGFGGFVGVHTLTLGSSSVEAFYGAISYSGDFGKVQIGAPRNALDDYVNAPMLGGVNYLDLQLSIFSGSYVPAALLSSGSSAAGLRYDGNFGAASVGLSYHDIEGTSVVDLAMNYSFGQTRLMAGVEHLSDSGMSANDVFLGAEHDFGQVTAGAVYGSLELVGDIESLQAYAIYSPNDRLDLTASYLNAWNSGAHEEFYGINANYNLTDIIYVDAGYMGNGGSDILAIGLGVDF